MMKWVNLPDGTRSRGQGSGKPVLKGRQRGNWTAVLLSKRALHGKGSAIRGS